MIKFLFSLFFSYFIICAVGSQPTLLDDDIPVMRIHDHATAFVSPRTKAVAVALIDDAFTIIENDIIKEATYYIEYSTNDAVKVILVSQAERSKPLMLPINATIFPIMVKKVDSYDPQVMATDEELKNTILGLYDYKAMVPTVLIVYSRIQDTYTYAGVFEHEIMHALGMKHSNYPDQLMNPRVSSACPGQRDVLQLSHLFELNPDDMNPCINDTDVPACLADEPINY